ncbi:MAG TPA: NBR1-Ig-like domain-containing protein [Anaerolineales bacterium]
MLTNKLFTPSTLKYAIRLSYCVLLFLLAACSPATTPTPFIAPFTQKLTPTASVSSPVLAPTLAVTLQVPGAIATSTETLAAPTLEATLAAPTAETASTTPSACTDSLRYLQDLTYPDGSAVTPGQILEKQWRVENNGSCNWDGRYRLKLLDGYPALGAASEQALFPARAGAQSTLSIFFTAPAEPGTYRTAWQAFNPDGVGFGEVVYMEIIVGQ